jgi:glucose/mannose transport system substrate-binding protein
MRHQILLSLASVLTVLSMHSPASAQTADVQQYWTSASESKAMNVVADAFKAKGGTWIDSPAANFDEVVAAATSRIAGGQPPTAVLMTPGGAMRDLAAAGQLRYLDDLAEEGGWQKAMAPIVWDRLSVDGHLIGVPVGVHGSNWIWYSKALFDKLGIAEPTNIDEMFAAADKLKAAGYIGFAIGGEPWQEANALGSMIVAEGGADLWNALFVNRDPEAAKSPALAKAFDSFRKLSTYADPASPGRSWNTTTDLVITDKAGMQFMGDWARGEFLAAGKVAGKDFGCFISPSAKPAYVIVVDIFTFPVNTDEDRIKGQTLLAQTMMDPAVEAKVAAVKGNIPGRLDVDTSTLDECAAKGVNAMAVPGAAVPDPYLALPADMNGQFTDLATQFWTDPTMTSAAAAEKLGELLQAN